MALALIDEISQRAHTIIQYMYLEVLDDRRKDRHEIRLISIEKNQHVRQDLEDNNTLLRSSS